jgi:hypothetical protein
MLSDENGKVEVPMPKDGANGEGKLECVTSIFYWPYPLLVRFPDSMWKLSWKCTGSLGNGRGSGGQMDDISRIGKMEKTGKKAPVRARIDGHGQS